MKRNTLEKLYIALKYELPEIVMSEDLLVKSRRSINKMLEISAQYGL
jgi:quinolinate synthase